MPTKPTHTPGPWHLDCEDWPLVVNCPEEDQDEAAKNGHPWYIAEIRLPEGSTGVDAMGDQAAANALLIAAAPDLLAALTGFLEHYDGDLSDDALDMIVSNARAVVAKAEGRVGR